MSNLGVLLGFGILGICLIGTASRMERISSTVEKMQINEITKDAIRAREWAKLSPDVILKYEQTYPKDKRS